MSLSKALTGIILGATFALSGCKNDVASKTEAGVSESGYRMQENGLFVPEYDLAAGKMKSGKGEKGEVFLTLMDRNRDGAYDLSFLEARDPAGKGRLRMLLEDANYDSAADLVITDSVGKDLELDFADGSFDLAHDAKVFYLVITGGLMPKKEDLDLEKLSENVYQMFLPSEH